MAEKRSIFIPILWRIVALVGFILLILLINVFSPFIENSMYQEVVKFVNDNLFLIFLISFVFVVSELFWMLHFPFNLPSPLFSAVAWVLLAWFLFNVLEFLDLITGSRISPFISSYLYLIYTIIFVIVVILEYFQIFSKMRRRNRH